MCKTCHGRGWIGHRFANRDACPECTFEAEIEYQNHLRFERMKRGDYRKLGKAVKFRERRTA